MIDQHVGRKAQITVFIILGIVLVAGVAAFFLLRQQSTVLPAEVAVADEAPIQFKPIQDFITSCLNTELKDAFVVIGQHGGYLDMSDAELSKKLFSLKPEDPTSSDAAFFSSDVPSHVAYWWYLKSDNKCSNCLLTDENKPSFSYIEQQSDEYIRRNLASCLDGFRGFENQGFRVDVLSQPSAKTQVTETDVVTYLDFAVNASIGDDSVLLSRYYTKIPLDFRKFYELASSVSNAEINSSFLEYVAKGMIGVYGSGDTSGLPPIYLREESFVPRMWSKTVVEGNFKSLLTSHVPLLSLKGTKNARLVSGADAFSSGLYKSFYYEKMLSQDYGNFSVNFYYLGWPVYFYVGPGSGEMLTATKVREIRKGIGPFTLFPTLPTREYAFFYDVSYPIIVEVRRDSELFGDGYSLFFALESNLRDNRDMKEWVSGNGTYGSNIKDLFTLVSVAERELPETSEEAGLTLEQVVNNSQKDSKSLFCRPKQRISGNITVSASDRFSRESLDGVRVKFGCGLYEFCDLGNTCFDLDSGTVFFVSKFPICRGGGILKLEKPGYLTEIITDVDVAIDSSADFAVEMTPIVKKEVKIRKVLLNRTVLYFDPYEDSGKNYTKLLSLSTMMQDPDPKEDNIVVVLRNMDTSMLSNFQTQVIMVDQSLDSSSVDLVPGRYDIKVSYVKMTGANVSPSLRCKSHAEHDDYANGISDAQCFSMPEEAIVLQQIVAGGLEFNDYSGYWVVSEGSVAANNTIELKVMQLPPLTLIEDFDEMDMIANLSQRYRSELNPVFVPVR